MRLAPYSAQANGSTDDTAAIQSALTAAGAAGGGTVYLPPGLYRLNGHLTVPAGVELRGSDDVPHRAMLMGRGTGTVLLAYEGRATATPDTATPFILLNGAQAGVRGLSIHYPEQSTASAASIVAYPWSIRGNGAGVYAYDLAFSNAWRAIDFATNPTNNHYVNQVVGLALKEGIRVGNSSEGWMEDSLFNINAWARANGLPNILDEATTDVPGGGDLHAGEPAGLRGHQRRGQPACAEQLRLWRADRPYVRGHRQRRRRSTWRPTAAATRCTISGTGANGVKIVNAEGCGCSNGGAGLRVTGGNAKVWNLVTMETYSQADDGQRRSALLRGAAFHHSQAQVTGGTLTMTGALFRDSGTHITVGSGATANLWGNVGGGSAFSASYAGGSSGTATNNISGR